MSLPALIIYAEKIAANIIHGEHAQRKTGAGEKFWQFREYHPTDRPQDIDWRQSAKGDTVFIKQKEWQTTRKTYLWCAGGATMNFTSDKSRLNKQAQAQALALSLALLLKKAKEQIGVFGHAQTGRSEDHLQKIAQSLFDRKALEEELPDTDNFLLPQHAELIAIGDFLSPIEEIEQSFQTIAARTENAIIVQVLDPAEMNLSYKGRVKFKGVDHHSETINHVSSIKDDYNARIHDHINAIKSLCAVQGWTYVLHSADHDIVETLRTIWSITNEGSARS